MRPLYLIYLLAGCRAQVMDIFSGIYRLPQDILHKSGIKGSALALNQPHIAHFIQIIRHRRYGASLRHIPVKCLPDDLSLRLIDDKFTFLIPVAIGNRTAREASLV